MSGVWRNIQLSRLDRRVCTLWLHLFLHILRIQWNARLCGKWHVLDWKSLLCVIFQSHVKLTHINKRLNKVPMYAQWLEIFVPTWSANRFEYVSKCYHTPNSKWIFVSLNIERFHPLDPWVISVFKHLFHFKYFNFGGVITSIENQQLFIRIYVYNGKSFSKSDWINRITFNVCIFFGCVH